MKPKDLDFKRADFGDDTEMLNAFAEWVEEKRFAALTLIGCEGGQHNIIQSTPLQLVHMLYYLCMKDEDIRDIVQEVAGLIQLHNKNQKMN